jgi:hypothetical protein
LKQKRIVTDVVAYDLETLAVLADSSFREKAGL